MTAHFTFKLKLTLDMKKYITIAALLAAGSAFANALTITEDTTMSPEGNFFAGEFEFSFEIPVNTDSAAYILGYYADPAASGGYAANVFTLEKSGENYTLGLKRVSSVTVTNGDITAIGTVHNTSTFTYSETEGNQKNYFLSTGEEYTVKYLGGDNKAAGAELYHNDVLVASFSKGSHNMNGGGSGDATLNVKVNEAYVIPEPSTFGLLAGLGALALVGTRRRRR